LQIIEMGRSMEKAILSPKKSHFSRIILWMPTGIFLLAVVLYFVIGFVAADLVTKPIRNFSTDLSPAKYRLTYENITITARIDSMQIAGWFIPSESRKVVIIVHGRNQSRTSYGGLVELADYLHRNGLNVVMLDLRGHGQSPDAKYSFGLMERRDVEGAVDWLTQRGYEQEGIGVLGISLGAAAVIGAAAEEPKISAVVEDSGFAELYPILEARSYSDGGLPGFLLTPTLWMIKLRYGYDLSQVRPVNEVGTIAPRPLLIIHSVDDQIVPVENAMQLKEAYPEAETWILHGPEHACAFYSYPEEYSQRVSSFFNKYLK
jgi:pimeloyl-ACP methyl ester carboxylesterase